jgi:hypothetical protein
MSARATSVVLAVLMAAAGISGCGHRIMFAVPSAAQKPKPCTVRLQAPPSAVAVLVHRDSAASRRELTDMLLTARPNEHLFIFKAATGKLVGSFTTPPGPALVGPTPPSPLPADPTQVESYIHGQEIDRYDQELAGDRARLHLRWVPRLAAWANYVISQAAAPPWNIGPYLASEVPGLLRALRAAAASVTSLNNIPGSHLGTRIVVAILGLEKVPVASPPSLPGGLQEATIVVAGFTGTSGQESVWRADWARGAQEIVLLTPSTDGELTAAVAPVLDRAGQRRPPTAC